METPTLAAILFLGVMAAVLLDYGSHRLMHVPFRRGPLKRMFLHHLAHHRYPQDEAILAFAPVRRTIDGALAALALGAFGVAAWPCGMGAPTAALAAALFVLPGLAYNRVYDALHRRVHVGGEGPLGGSRLFARIRAHHLAHHHHRRGVAGFRDAGGLSLIFPFI